KILSQGERLPTTWPVQGTTGYEFMNDIEDVFVDPNGFREIETHYRAMRRLVDSRFADAARGGKRAVLEGPLRADVVRLARRLAPLAREAGQHWTNDELATGITDFIVALPVYRTYVAQAPANDIDRAVIDRALTKLADPKEPIANFVAEAVRQSSEFTRKLQQVSGPATAKGVEDTALYQYVPLVSVNEVGGGPDRPIPHSVERFHAGNIHRAARWPLSLTATNTHDTKRSADLRARLDALSEIPAEWDRSVHRWRRLNAKHRQTIDGRLAPDTNSEYLIYQTLVGIWPPPRTGRRADDIPDRGWRLAARERLVQYVIKASREAKIRTSWTEPNLQYEEALGKFVAAILEPGEDAPFLVDVSRLVSRIGGIGAWSSIARIALHLTSPGTPDTYQGDECWTFTLVDPDNRRPIDYLRRAELLQSPRDFWADPFDHRFKQHIVNQLLTLRHDRAELFMQGSYSPLLVHGARADHVVAFARTLGDRCVITIAPRLVGEWIAAGRPDTWWGDTAVVLPLEFADTHLRSVLSPAAEQDVVPSSGKLELAALLRTIPVAVLAD
ncbi:MAG TPA: hypothetical protein VGM67_00420, partial [Gemmatimonadaceae bacterium]